VLNVENNNKRLALSVGLYFGDEEPTRAQEYQAVQVAGGHGYNLCLEDRYSDEQVFLVQEEYLDPTTLDHTTPDSLEASLKAQGYEVVDLFTWVESQHQPHL
jgi:hypothetical protein